jgi:hypothetical protein
MNDFKAQKAHEEFKNFRNFLGARDKGLKWKFQTKREDWFFIISATTIWISALIVIVWDFLTLQRMIYRLVYWRSLYLYLNEFR